MISSNNLKSFLFCLLLFWIFAFSHPAIALKPDELLVIANKKNADSIKLAHFYMQQRNIPIKNFLFVDTTKNESCSRESYKAEIENPVRYYFKQNSVESRAIRCVVLMYGIDDTESLFQSGSNLDTALYCGWYSLAKYVDAFLWQKGSVGYHIASSECSTLKEHNRSHLKKRVLAQVQGGPELHPAGILKYSEELKQGTNTEIGLKNFFELASSQVWCKKMLEKGIAATIGPVYEPYIAAFPVPDIFFGYLADGYLSLAECYILSTRFLSWQMVLIGDPLYKPFYKRAKSP